MMTDSLKGRAPALQASDVTKVFGDLRANDSVSLSVFAGEVHAVVGENGAGKTTLMRMLSGELQPDAGVISLDGVPKTLRNPQEAVASGIGLVHQHYSVIPDFSLLDNLLLTVPGGSFRRLTSSQRREALQFLRDEGFPSPDRTLIKDLAVDEVQRFEISKLLYVGARILILDEPTAVLGPIEIDRLYSRLADLANEGKAIVVITHKLREVERYAQRVTVMRGGRTVLSQDSCPPRPALLSAMFGDEARIHAEEELETASAAAERLGDVVLDVSGISVVGRDDRLRVDDVSFTVRAGQVLAIVGVEGNGQSYLMDSLAGLQSCTGSVTLNGKDIAQLGPRERYEAGLRAVTEDRLKWDVFRSASVSENVLAHEYAGRGSLGYVNPRGKTVVELVSDILNKFDVRPVAPKMALSKLSGGNQQRAVVGRESTGPKSVLLLSHPTRGLDVMGAAIILEDVRSQQAQGTAVVWNTADLDEAFVVGDVLLVMFQGRAALLVDRRSTSHEVVAAAMSGAN